VDLRAGNTSDGEEVPSHVARRRALIATRSGLSLEERHQVGGVVVVEVRCLTVSQPSEPALAPAHPQAQCDKLWPNNVAP
jgi:hypothetical protein